MTVHIGLIGLGKIGKIRLGVLKHMGDVTIEGFVDPAVSAREIGVPKFESVEALLDHRPLSAAFVAVPNYLSVPIILRALERGLSVFAEKPPARSISELESLEPQLQRSRDSVLMFGFNHQFKSGVRKLFAEISSQRLGRILWVRARYGKELEAEFYSNWRSDFQASGGGILLDQGIHMVDIVRQLLGNIDGVQSHVSNNFTGIPGIEDNVFAILSCDDTGAVASLHSTMTQWRYIFSLEVFLEFGSIVLNGLRTPSGNYGAEVLTVHSRDRNGDNSSVEYSFGEELDDSWSIETEAFITSVKTQTPVKLGNYSQAKASLSLVEQIYAADSGFFRPQVKQHNLRLD